jgi:hypothetical protein
MAKAKSVGRKSAKKKPSAKKKLSVKRTPLKAGRNPVSAADRSRARGVDRGRARVRKF